MTHSFSSHAEFLLAATKILEESITTPLSPLDEQIVEYFNRKGLTRLAAVSKLKAIQKDALEEAQKYDAVKKAEEGAKNGQERSSNGQVSRKASGGRPSG